MIPERILQEHTVKMEIQIQEVKCQEMLNHKEGILAIVNRKEIQVRENIHNKEGILKEAKGIQEETEEVRLNIYSLDC